MTRYTTALVTAVILGGSHVSGQVVINEFSYDDIGGDAMEYLELYNAGSEPVDMSGWKFETGVNTVEKISIIPDSTILAPGGFFLIGTNAEGSGVVSVPIDMYHENNFRNFTNFFTLRDASDNIVDSVVHTLCRNTGNDEFQGPIVAGHGEPPHDGAGNGGGIYGYQLAVEAESRNDYGFSLTSDPNATLTWQRSPIASQLDSDNNERDFHLAIATPRAMNFSNGTVTPAQVAAGITFDFEGADGTVVTDLPGNHSSFNNQDPSAVDTIAQTAANRTGSPNPSVIPAAPAPGGGNIGIFWGRTDLGNSGFGGSAILNLTEPIYNVEAETLIYIGPALSGTQYETGSYFVLRGRPDHMHFMGYDPLNPYYPNGDVGVRIRMENNVGGSGEVNLYVEQHIDGVLTSYGDPVNIPAAGWYRILLSVYEDKVAAILGGEYGSLSTDGTLEGGIRFPADSGTYTTTIDVAGGVGMNFNTEALDAGNAANAAHLVNVRPPTYDQLTFRAPVLAGPANVNDWGLY